MRTLDPQLDIDGFFVRETRRNPSASVWLQQPWELTAFLERWPCETACA